MKIGLCLALLVSSSVWADEAADRTAVEKTVSALNRSLSSANIFTADFGNVAELQSLRESVAPRPTLVISRAPMGEATWSPGVPPLFVTRSVTFVSAATAVAIVTYENQAVLFVVKKVDSDWRIASFRLLPEAQSTQPLN